MKRYESLIPVFFIAALIISCIVLNIVLWTWRIDYCKQNSDLSTFQCAMLTINGDTRR